MKKAVFIDRDGVLNRKAPEGQYVTSWREMIFLSKTAKAIRLLNKAAFVVVIVSNQSCVDKGLITRERLESMHERLQWKFKAAGASIDAIYYCPHTIEACCACRKPQSGMLLDAARRYGLDLSRCWIIGDSVSDIGAGRNAGCKTVFVHKRAPSETTADLLACSLWDATLQILGTRERLISPST